MTRRVEWSRDALEDLKSQLIYIARDNPIAARNVVDRIRAVCAALGEMPTGRPGRIAGTYEKSVAQLPYIIAYAITQRGGAEKISISRVIHAARDWQPEQWPKS